MFKFISDLRCAQTRGTILMYGPSTSLTKERLNLVDSLLGRHSKRERKEKGLARVRARGACYAGFLFDEYY